MPLRVNRGHFCDLSKMRLRHGWTRRSSGLNWRHRSRTKRGSPTCVKQWLRHSPETERPSEPRLCWRDHGGAKQNGRNRQCWPLRAWKRRPQKPCGAFSRGRQGRKTGENPGREQYVTRLDSAQTVHLLWGGSDKKGEALRGAMARQARIVGGALTATVTGRRDHSTRRRKHLPKPDQRHTGIEEAEQRERTGDWRRDHR